jgi:preprotein translocase subunit SecE
VTHDPSPAVEPAENGAPDPLEHATPDVEFAEAQLAAGRPPEPEPDAEADEEEFEAEVEESIAGGRARRGGAGIHPRASGAADQASPAGAGHAEAARGGIFTRLIAFLQGSWRELQRVQWPDRRQVMQATGVVIGFVIVCAAFLGLADLVSQKIVTFILK